MEEQKSQLPGAAFLARRIDRRRFLRKLGESLFYGMVAVASGAVSLSTFLADPAYAAGACCPSCCGPSPCCETNCCSKPCCQSSPYRWRCLNNGSTCLGYDYGTYSDACWSCSSGDNTTHCCDCKINNESGCSNPYATNRCICYGTEFGTAPQTWFGNKNDRAMEGASR